MEVEVKEVLVVVAVVAVVVAVVVVVVVVVVVEGGVERVEQADVEYVGRVLELGEVGEVVTVVALGEVEGVDEVVELGEVEGVEKVVEIGEEVGGVVALQLVGVREVRGLREEVCFVLSPMEQSKVVVDTNVRDTATVTLELGVCNAEVILQAILPPKDRW